MTPTIRFRSLSSLIIPVILYYLIYSFQSYYASCYILQFFVMDFPTTKSCEKLFMKYYSLYRFIYSLYGRPLFVPSIFNHFPHSNQLLSRPIVDYSPISSIIRLSCAPFFFPDDGGYPDRMINEKISRASCTHDYENSFLYI